VVARHEALRTTFAPVDTELVQVIHEPAEIDLPVEEGADLAEVRLPTCRDQNAPIPTPVRNPTPTPTGTTTPPPPQREFFRPAAGFTENAELPNADSAYAEAYLVRPASPDVVVLKGRARPVGDDHQQAV
jgi:hypothetical protein